MNIVQECLVKAHTLTEKQYELRLTNQFHAFAVRDNFEKPIRLYNFGKGEKPTIKEMLEKYIILYNEALTENKSLLTIGLCYSLLAREGNYTDGEPLYPEIDRGINCNWSYEKIINYLKTFKN